MAKFKELNLELQDDEKINLGNGQDAKIYFHNDKLRIQDCDIHFTGAVSGGEGTSRCSAYAISTQSVATAIMTIAELDTVLFDELGEFNTSTNRFVTTQPGYYILSGGLEIESIANGNYYTVCVYVNEGIKAIVHTEVGGGTSPRFNCTTIRYLAVGDYVTLRGRHNYGSNRTFGAGRSNTYLTIHKLS